MNIEQKAITTIQRTSSLSRAIPAFAGFISGSVDR